MAAISRWAGIPTPDRHFGTGSRKHPQRHGDGAVDKKQIIYAITLSTFTAVLLFTMVIVLFFYLLDSLLAERKDRSILFWKSLPVSDTEVVLSKLLTAAVVVPLFVLVVSSVLQVLFAARLVRSGSTVRFSVTR